MIRVNPSSAIKLAGPLSFILPALIRWIPEMQFPYPIGFDTPIYLAAAKTYATHLLVFPLFYQILGWLDLVGIGPMLSMKILPTLLYGLLGLSVYYFSRSYLLWDEKRSFLTSMVLALSTASLRISWDLNKEVFATVVLFLALAQVRKLGRNLRAPTFVGLALVVASDHQLVFAIMQMILISLIVEEVLAIGEAPVDKTRVAILSTAVLASSVVFLSFWYRNNLGGVYRMALSPFAVLPTISQSASTSSLEAYFPILVILYGLASPLIILGFFRRTVLSSWSAIALVGSFSFVISPSLALTHPERWMFLLAYPASFYSANALSQLGLYIHRTTLLLPALVAALFLCSVFSFALLGIVPAPPQMQMIHGYVPASMASSTAPIEDITSIPPLLSNLSTNAQDSVLITSINYYGWSEFYASIPVVYWQSWGRGPYTMAQTLMLANMMPVKNIYLLWYNDNEASALGFTVVAHYGTMTLFRYSGAS